MVDELSLALSSSHAVIGCSLAGTVQVGCKLSGLPVPARVA